MSGQVVIYVSYPSKTPSGSDTKFNMDYYMNSHVPMVNKHWQPHGLQSMTVSSFSAEDSLDGSMPPYCAQAVATFDSKENMMKALQAGGQESGADIPNYTDVTPVLWVAKVVK